MMTAPSTAKCVSPEWRLCAPRWPEAEACPASESAQLVRHRYDLQLRRAEAEVIAGSGATPESSDTVVGNDDAAVVHAALDAQRRKLVALRADGTIGDAAFQRVEQELDWTELGWAQVVGSSSGGGPSSEIR
jgi:CPA1 family monovalent cation:H+ antiporter